MLASLARDRMRAGRAGIEEALTGMFDAHHGELARIELDQIKFLDRKIAPLEDDIAAALDAIPEAQGVDADGTTGPPDPGPDAAVLPAAGGWRRSPASARTWPRRSSPRPAWT